MNTATAQPMPAQDNAQPPIIDCNEIMAEICTHQLATIVFNELRKHYLDVSLEMAEHAVSETLYGISFALRRGEILSIEAVGDFIPCQIAEQRVVRFIPAQSLFLPLGPLAKPLPRIADQRRNQPEAEPA